MTLRKNPIKTLKLKIWHEISVYVRNRDKICITCGARKSFYELDCGHYLPNTERGASAGGNKLWYDLRGYGAQCTKCNRFNSGEQAKFAEYLEKKYGHGILQELRKLRNTYKKWTLEELKVVYEHFKNLNNPNAY